VSEGSYVNPAQNGLLTTVAQLDPIFVNFNLSENEWLSNAEELKKGTLRFPTGKSEFEVQLVLSSTMVLPTKGRLNFSSQTVDPATGSYAIRASFANPDLQLRPGQFVRVRLLGATRPKAILVPQRAILQGQKGKFVYVIGAGDKAEMRPVEVGDWVADQWVVTAGLKSGERVVLDGTLKVQPGAVLKVATAAPAALAASAASSAQPAASR
jgi:membrane fusion protein (multidrug efflux system)